MAIKYELLAIMDYLNSVNEAVNLSDIMKNTSSLGLKKRAYNNLLRSLQECNRVTMMGMASVSTYIIREPIRAYQRYRSVFVYKGGILCGILINTDTQYVFIYDNAYIIRELEAIPSLDITIEVIKSDSLHPIFDENLPEGINEEIMDLKIKSGDIFDKLLSLKKNIGDLFFSKSNKEVSFSEHDEKASYLSHKEEILGKNIFPEILDHTLDISQDILYPEGIDLTKFSHVETQGISGFQYKKIVTIDEKKHSIVLSEGVDTLTQYILKPYSPIKTHPDSNFYLPHLAINEHLIMTFAKNELGFDVPRSCLIKEAGASEYHYLVKRFDRYGKKRFSKANFSSYLGLTRETKYRTTSEEMFTRISKEIISPKERMKLLKYYFYSILIVHEDMHTKNLSLITSPKSIVLSPLYDIACTGIYQFCKKHETAIPLNSKKNNIRPNDFKALAKTLGIDFRLVKDEFKEIIKIYLEVFPKYIQLLEKHFPNEFVYKIKVVPRMGEATYINSNDKETLANVFTKQYKLRCDTLKKFGWLDI